MKTQYVVGFAFDAYGAVALINKQKPEWMKGRWNGIGGKIEPGETPQAAMQREFKEEAGQDIATWALRGRIAVAEADVYVFSARVGILHAHTVEAEEVQLFTQQDQELLGNHTHPCLPNIPALLALVTMPASIKSNTFFVLDYTVHP